jgi:hypothetical protein
MYQGVEAYPRWGPASVLIHSLWADARRLFQCAGNPRMARCLSFAARRGGRPRRGVGGGIIEGRTISGVRGGVNASALCLHRDRSHGRGFREGFETADLSLPRFEDSLLEQVGFEASVPPHRGQLPKTSTHSEEADYPTVTTHSSLLP